MTFKFQNVANIKRVFFQHILQLVITYTKACDSIFQINIVLIEPSNCLQPQAREKAEVEGFEVSVAKTSFKANTKALAENEGEGIAKVVKYVKPSDLSSLPWHLFKHHSPYYSTTFVDQTYEQVCVFC